MSTAGVTAERRCATQVTRTGLIPAFATQWHFDDKTEELSTTVAREGESRGQRPRPTRSGSSTRFCHTCAWLRPRRLSVSNTVLTRGLRECRLAGALLDDDEEPHADIVAVQPDYSRVRAIYCRTSLRQTGHVARRGRQSVKTEGTSDTGGRLRTTFGKNAAPNTRATTSALLSVQNLLQGATCEAGGACAERRASCQRESC